LEHFGTISDLALGVRPLFAGEFQDTWSKSGVTRQGNEKMPFGTVKLGLGTVK
jgi:hypothetical protein